MPELCTFIPKTFDLLRNGEKFNQQQEDQMRRLNSPVSKWAECDDVPLSSCVQTVETAAL